MLLALVQLLSPPGSRCRLTAGDCFAFIAGARNPCFSAFTSRSASGLRMTPSSPGAERFPLLRSIPRD